MSEVHEVVVIGSGPSAVATISALLDRGIHPTVVDFGADSGKESHALKRNFQERITSDLKASIPQFQTNVHSLGQKHWFDSFVSYEQPSISQILYSNKLAVRASFGLGGFSRVWGATFKFKSPSDSANTEFQLHPADIEAINKLVPHAVTAMGTVEISTSKGIEPSPASRALFERIVARNFSNDVIEPSTVAINISDQLSGCVMCGACLTGCPVDSIWFAGDQIRRWASTGRIRYENGIFVEKVVEHTNFVSIYGNRGESGFHFDARRVFIATGPISTAALLIRSGIGERYTIRDSATAFGGAIDFRKPQEGSHHGLSQFWLTTINQSTTQIYPPSKDHAKRITTRFNLPNFMIPPVGYFLNFVHPLISYLPMADSGTIDVSKNGERIYVSSIENEKTTEMFMNVFRILRRTFSRVGLYVPLRGFEIGSPGSGFHIGSSLAHGKLSDTLGRPFGWKRLHVVDASVLPELPLGSITPTIMGNAHRIARTVDLSSN